MNRLFLILLMILDLAVMGSSGFILWDRVQKNLSNNSYVSDNPAQTIAKYQRAVAAKLNAENPAAHGDSAPVAEPQTEPERAPANDKNKNATFKYHDAYAERVSIIG